MARAVREAPLRSHGREGAGTAYNLPRPTEGVLPVAPYRIELRSDTQTVPTADMREAMAQADVGDEQWGEDPTVLELERTSAEMFGREAGLFVPSGTMGNLTSMLASTERGDTVIVDGLSHMVGRERQLRRGRRMHTVAGRDGWRARCGPGARAARILDHSARPGPRCSGPRTPTTCAGACPGAQR